MYTTRPPAYRSQAPQPIPAESGPSVSADWPPWHGQLSGVSVLPAQFFSPRVNPYTGCPEAALMRAVLEDALACFQRQFDTKRRWVQRVAQEAEEWLFSADSDGLFSFVSVCTVLGLEPTSIRQMLKRWSQSSPTTPRSKMHASHRGRFIAALHS